MKLYLHYLSISVRCTMEYKKSFFLTTLGQFLVSFNVFLGVYFMMERFHSVKGFTFNEVLLCFSIVLMSFAAAECFFRGFDLFANMMGNGEFDRILVQPRSPMFQVLASKIELTKLGRLLQAVVMLVIGLAQGTVDWDIWRVITMILMLIGGVVIFSGLYILYAGICFFTLEGLEVMNIFTDGAREYGKYPLSIYGKEVLTFCSYIIPFALFQYYPLLYLLGRDVPAWYGILPLCPSCFWCRVSLCGDLESEDISLQDHEKGAESLRFIP